MEQQNKNVSLPDNAYRELKAGEEYKPLMSAESTPAEVTPYSVTMGILMAIIFSAAAAFLGLKVGQVFEAAIPIAIIAVGMGTALGKKNMLGQNVIIQSIGASSGVIVAGAIFTPIPQHQAGSKAPQRSDSGSHCFCTCCCAQAPHSPWRFRPCTFQTAR